jgi:hypothetical protein
MARIKYLPPLKPKWDYPGKQFDSRRARSTISPWSDRRLAQAVMLESMGAKSSKMDAGAAKFQSSTDKAIARKPRHVSDPNRSRPPTIRGAHRFDEGVDSVSVRKWAMLVRLDVIDRIAGKQLTGQFPKRRTRIEDFDANQTVPNGVDRSALTVRCPKGVDIA